MEGINLNIVNASNINETYNLITAIIKKSRVKKNVNMAKYTSFKAGGVATLLVSPKTEEELCNVMKVIFEENCEYFVIGNGTNILIRDGGFEGVIVHMGESMDHIQRQGNFITAGGGTLLSSVAKQALNNGLGGIEFGGGIPGSIGGAVAMNAGAYGGEMKDFVTEVKAMDNRGNIFTIAKEQMGFSYRKSIFQEKNYIVLETTLELKEEDRNVIKERMKGLAKQRNEKQPIKMPSAGSFFKRPEGTFAGKLIEEAGLKGLKLGGAQVSDLHSNFIINTGTATATDIVNLMALVQSAVAENCGILLEPEVKIIGKL